MILSDFCHRWKEVIPISLNSHSILKEYYNTFSNLPLENYHVVTRSKNKAAGIHLSKVHGADKFVNPSLKRKTWVKREGIIKPITMIPKSMPQQQKTILLRIHRKSEGRAGVRRKIVGPKNNLYCKQNLRIHTHPKYFLNQNFQLW